MEIDGCRPSLKERRKKLEMNTVNNGRLWSPLGEELKAELIGLLTLWVLLTEAALTPSANCSTLTVNSDNKH